MTLYKVTQHIPNFISCVTPEVACNVALEDIEHLPWFNLYRKQPDFYQIVVSKYYQDKLLVQVHMRDGKNYVVAIADPEKPEPTLESTAIEMGLDPAVAACARVMYHEHRGFAAMAYLDRQPSEYWIGWLLQAKRRMDNDGARAVANPDGRE